MVHRQAKHLFVVAYAMHREQDNPRRTAVGSCGQKLKLSFLGIVRVHKNQVIAGFRYGLFDA
ncbi:hypothetical protein D3C73_1602150 [compost metagenome]